MTATARVEATEQPRLGSLRRIALVAGVFYILTFVSIPVLVLYGPVHDPTYILGPGPDNGVVYGVLLELVVALAGIGTAVTLFPVVRRQNESLALGFVATRTLEAALIFVGAVALLTVVTVRQDLAGAGGPALAAIGSALVGVYDWTFSLGQGLMPVANAVLLGTLMYRSGLVPRAIPLLGLIGAPILLVSKITTILGLSDALSAWSALAAVPIAAWELSLGLWLLIKGFRSCPLTVAITTGAR
jgi:Domain of unknown function (DUF4386)